ncbi:hypothetical protein U1Q18_049274 [Sarracenia purpurea var. burkii]
MDHEQRQTCSESILRNTFMYHSTNDNDSENNRSEIISAEEILKSDGEYENTDDGHENANDDSNNAASNLEEQVDSDSEDEDTDDPESPTLTCLLFGDLGCSTKCSITADAFSIQGSGQCTTQNVCQCTVQQQSLDDLLRAKFQISNRVIEKIKSEKKTAAKVLKVLQKPFQTAAQIREQLKDIVDLGIYNQLYTNDQILAFKWSMIDEMGEPDSDIVKSFVYETLKPVLENVADKLKGVDYKSKLTDALKNTASNSEDLQNIMTAVRRTENRSLIRTLNAFVKSNRKIRETESDKKDSLVDVIDYFTVDQFVYRIDQLNKPPAKEPVRKQTSRNTAGNKRSILQGKETTEPRKLEVVKMTANPKNPESVDITTEPKKPETVETTTKPTKPESIEKTTEPKQSESVEIPPSQVRKPTEETSKKEDSNESAKSRFHLSDIDHDFAKKTKGRLIKTFTTDEYIVQYQRGNRGDIVFAWKKGNDEVEMRINAAGTSISQTWHLENANIKLNLASGSYKTEVWDFGSKKIRIQFLHWTRWLDQRCIRSREIRARENFAKA